MKHIIIKPARWISVIALTASPLAAEILTVDNKPGSVAMYATVQAAYDAAEQDDTIVLAASPASYGVLTVYKRLHFRGPGYLLSENGIPGTALAGNTANCDFTFDKSDSIGTGTGSTVAELETSGSISEGVSATFDKCYVRALSVQGSVLVRRCFLAAPVDASRASVSVTIRDSISTSRIDLPINEIYGVGTIDRCVLSTIGGNRVGNTVTNSIIVNSSISAASFANSYRNSVSHCMAVGGSFLTVGNNNINGANLVDVFSTGSPDGQWRLRTTSPARGAGFNGIDLGAFGGTQPYILSGLPSKPRLTRFIAPAVASGASGLRIELDARSF